MASWVQRMVGAAKLDVATYEEVEADSTATIQAMGVVLLSAAAAGIGDIGHGGRGIIGSTAIALIGWVAWAFLTWLIGTKFLAEPETKADVGQLLRTIGFAATPGLFRVFGWIPILGNLIEVAAMLWMLVAMVVAVRQALDYKGTGRAILVCAIGWFVNVVILFTLGALLGIAVIGAKGMSGP
ncbi:MAG TPA: hypothetical protein VIX13_05880 [Candidatus Eisenbacteria bacterium]